jgi:hypothetical protein
LAGCRPKDGVGCHCLLLLPVDGCRLARDRLAWKISAMGEFHEGISP